MPGSARHSLMALATRSSSMGLIVAGRGAVTRCRAMGWTGFEPGLTDCQEGHSRARLAVSALADGLHVALLRSVLRVRDTVRNTSTLTSVTQSATAGGRQLAAR